MDMNLICHVNYFAILGASVAYFFIGSWWFSPALFGSVWRRELENHRVVIKEPTSGQLGLKMGITFLSTILTAYGMACLINMTGITTVVEGLKLGLLVSACYVLSTVATIFTWESRSMTLFLIDVGYPIAGILLSSVILSLWR